MELVCEFVVGWVEGQLKNGTTEHRIAEEIGFLCNILPWPIDNAVRPFVALSELLQSVASPSFVAHLSRTAECSDAPCCILCAFSAYG